MILSQCVPILGTGYGGLHQVAGEVVKLMLPLLVDAANASGVDVAVVTNEPEAYAAAQVSCFLSPIVSLNCACVSDCVTV